METRRKTRAQHCCQSQCSRCKCVLKIIFRTQIMFFEGIERELWSDSSVNVSLCESASPKLCSKSIALN